MFVVTEKKRTFVSSDAVLHHRLLLPSGDGSGRSVLAAPFLE